MMTRMHQPSPAPARRLRILLIALLAAAAAAGTTPGPAAAIHPDAVRPAGDPIAAAEPVPACTTGDDPAPFRDEPQWRSTLLDTRYRVGRRYAPAHLVSTARAGLNGGYRVRGVVRDDLAAMARAARRAGVTLRVTSAYRTWEEQAALYEAFVDELGPEKAALRAARPGHSEHHLGTALDFANTSGAYAWLAAKGWRFGFVVSYPPGERDMSCYRSEPWHLRYVGRTRAAEIHASGLVPRAWLWVNVVNAPQ